MKWVVGIILGIVLLGGFRVGIGYRSYPDKPEKASEVTPERFSLSEGQNIGWGRSASILTDSQTGEKYLVIADVHFASVVLMPKPTAK